MRSPQAGIYTRISRDPTGTALGVQRQQEDCQAVADARGWPVAGIYTDNDVSAYSGRHRPQYARLCADIAERTIDAVICWHPDRLHRSPLELNEFIELVEATGCQVVTVQAGAYDLTTPAGRLSARIVGDVARHESEHRSERLRRKHLQLAQAGRVPGGGTRPFGYEADRVTLRPAEAQLIREAADRVLAGDTLHSIVRDWTDRGVPTVTGKPWQPTILRRTLTSGRIAGWREHHGRLVAPAVWPAAIDRATLEQLRIVLLDPGRRTNHRPRRYLLTGGLARCGQCGADLVARPKADGRRCYVCASDPQFGGCGKIRVLAAELETHVSRLVLARLSSPKVQRALRDVQAGVGTDAAELVASVEADERRLEDLTTAHFVDGVVDRARYLDAHARLTERLAGARRRLEHLASVVPSAAFDPGLADRWPDMTVERCRVVVAAVMDHVAVGPAVRGRNFFDPGRVGEPVWRV